VSVMDRMGVAVHADDRDVPTVDLKQLRRLGMLALYARGVPVREIAAHYRVTRMTVWREIQKVNPEAGRRVLQA
jgi:transposase